jgi:hypothetical protein
MVIRRLKKEVADLRQEIALLKGGDDEAGEVSDETRKHLEELVAAYVRYAKNSNVSPTKEPYITGKET